MSNLLKDFETRKKRLLSAMETLKDKIETERELTSMMRDYIKRLKQVVGELEEMME